MDQRLAVIAHPTKAQKKHMKRANKTQKIALKKADDIGIVIITKID